MKWLRFAVKNVLRNHRRSAVTVLIAAVGTAAILIGGGFALFTYESLQEAAARETGHLILADKGYFGGDEEVPLQHGLARHAELRKEVLARSEVRSVLPRLELQGLLSNGEKSAVYSGVGVDPDGEFAARGPFLDVVEGGELSLQPKTGAVPEVMLGKELARSLRAKPGSSLTLLATTTEGALNAQDVVVKGLFSVGVPELDKRLLFVHLATAQRLLLTDKVSTLAVRLDETAHTGGTAASIAAQHPELALKTWLDLAFYYLGVRGLYDRIFGLLGAVLVVMVLFAVSNTLAMAVVERTREIGTLRAIGSLPGEIVRNFALEGLVLGAAGSLLGATVAAIASIAFDVLGLRMPPPPGRSVGYPLHVNLSLPLLAATVLVIVAVSASAALVISRRASRMPIVEALSHV